MSDTLYKQIKAQANWYNKEAKKHSRLNRVLWLASSIIAFAVAICANIDFQISGVTSSRITAVLSILLPVVTGYTILRNPESLWVIEIGIRNKLKDLKMKISWNLNAIPILKESHMRKNTW